jgi:hypothetical protein
VLVERLALRGVVCSQRGQTHQIKFGSKISMVAILALRGLAGRSATSPTKSRPTEKQ